MAQAVQNYETMVVISQTLPEEERQALIEKLRGIIAAGTELREVSLWGKRRLAYPIDKKTEAYYVIFYFQSPDAADVLAQIEKICRYDENVLRSMSLKVPMRKKGQEVAQLVPSPGWLANFKLEPRSAGPRRRPDSSGPRGDRDGGPRGEAPRPAAAPAEGGVATQEAPAPAQPEAQPEAKPEAKTEQPSEG